MGVIDAINAAAANAIEGAGVFAFATKQGIEAFLSQPNIVAMNQAGYKLILIVGMDAITNAEAIMFLREYSEAAWPLFEAYAFLHNHSGTFHPKICWFDLPHQNELRLIVGSGNLTSSGLGLRIAGPRPSGNWEAFLNQSESGAEREATLEQFGAWLNEQRAAGRLRALTDPQVQERAVANGRVRFSRPTLGNRPEEAEQAPPGGIGIRQNVEILILELPKNRLGQADIGREGLAFLGFVDDSITILRQFVSHEGAVGAVEEQKLFAVKSRNYRIEIPEIRDIGYNVDARDNRMFLILVKMDERSCRYSLIDPGFEEYELIASVMPPKMVGGSRSMRRRRLHAEDLKRAWPAMPDELVPVTINLPEP